MEHTWKSVQSKYHPSHYIIGNTHTTHSIWLNAMTILFIFISWIFWSYNVFLLFKLYSLMLAFKRIWKFCIAQVRKFFKNDSTKVCLNLFFLFKFIVICFNYIALLRNHWFIPKYNKSASWLSPGKLIFFSVYPATIKD